MNHSQKLAKRVEAVLLNGHWIAHTNLQNEANLLSMEMAQKKVHGLNTALELIFHIRYYSEGIAEVLNGGPLSIKDAYSFHAPPINSEEDWQAFRTRLEQSSKALIQFLSQMPEESWDQDFADGTYGSIEQNIEGFIEHTYYHLGQLRLVRKLLHMEG
jgi:uncharacterized damage-inducible protein DinB